MKKQITSLLLFLLLSAIGHQAKAQKNLLDLVPNEALFVGTLHAESIEKKVGWQKLSEYSVVEEALRRSASYINGDAFLLLKTLFFQKPQEKGLDLSGNSYLFAETAGSHIYWGIVFHLKDAGKFKSTIEAEWGTENINKLTLKNQYAVLIKDGLAIAWQKDHAFIGYVHLQREQEEDSDAFEIRRKSVLDNYTDEICNLEVDRSYSHFEKFSTWEKSIRDAGLWLDYKKAYNSLVNEETTAMYSKEYRQVLSAMMELYGDMYRGSDIAFENGKIISETRTYMGPDAMSITAAAASKKLDPRVLKYLDGERAGVYFTMTISPKSIYEGWKALLKDKAGPMKHLVGDAFGIFEIFIDEKATFDLFKGDIFYAFNGVRSIESTEIDYVYNEDKGIYDEVKRKVTRQMPTIALGLSYGNRENIMKFIRLIKGTGFLKEEKKNLFSLSIPGSAEQVFIKLDKGLLVMSNDSERLVKNKKYRPLSKAHQQYIKSDWQTVFFSPAKMLDMIMATTPLPNSADKDLIKQLREGLGDLWVHSYRPKAGDSFFRQEFSFEFSNKEENSLKLMFDFIEKMYQSTLKGI